MVLLNNSAKAGLAASISCILARYMDFLDPKKQRAHTIQLFIGYALVAIAIATATLILVYQAKGYWIDRSGQVIQNGLVFMSSQPSPADVYLDGIKKDATNTRLNLPAGQYNVELRREGYRTWQHTVSVEGGNVVDYSYPLLLPTKLTNTNKQGYTTPPFLVTQSPDRRWLLVAQPLTENATNLIFEQHDLKNPKQLPTTITLPSAVAAGASTDSWEVIEWAKDNRRMLLKHNDEFILFDRADSSKSVNLTQRFGGALPTITLHDKEAEDYLVYDAEKQALFTTTLENPTLKPYVDKVLAYKTYSKDFVVYATGEGAVAGKSRIMIRHDDKNYQLRSVPSGGRYLLDVTRYENEWYVAAGASNEDKVYLYVNPMDSLNKAPKQTLVPVSTLRVADPNYLAFSSNARFIAVENGSSFAVYDAEYNTNYRYSVAAPLDAPQAHARWMDGHRLSYVSGGQMVILDYDNTNVQTVSPANPQHLPYFDAGYSFVYALVNGQDGKTSLTSTALKTPADL